MDHAVDLISCNAGFDCSVGCVQALSSNLTSQLDALDVFFGVHWDGLVGGSGLLLRQRNGSLPVIRFLDSVGDLAHRGLSPRSEGTRVLEPIINGAFGFDFAMEHLVHGPETLEALLAAEEGRLKVHLLTSGTLQGGGLLALGILTNVLRISVFHIK